MRGTSALDCVKQETQVQSNGRQLLLCSHTPALHHLFDDSLWALFKPSEEAITDAIELGICDEGTRGGAL